MNTAMRRHRAQSPGQRCMLATVALVGLSICAAAAQAQGLRYGFEPAARFGSMERTTVMTIRGEVEEGDALRFARFVVDQRGRFIEHGGRIVLAIDGGDVMEAVRIGELLRESLSEVWLPDAASSRCISACFFIFVHAVSRDAVADAVGIHRPYLDRRALANAAPAAVRARYESLAAELRGRMEQLSVPVALVERMFGLTAGKVYWLSREDLDSLGRRQAWFDDYLAARCGRREAAEENATDAPAPECIDQLLREHRKGIVDRLAAERG